MKNKEATRLGAKPPAKPRAKPVAKPLASRLPPVNARRAESGGGEPVKSVRPPARSSFMRLAAEVDKLAAQLQASRSRIADLEARVDVDPLTDVLNRRGFERELTRSLAYVKRYGASAALVYLDLDGFKPVNDRHGHAAGDAVLKAIAAALTQQVRASDVVARIGGDEFAVLLWNIGEAEAAAKAAALEAAVYATPVTWETSTFAVTASAGMAPLQRLDTPAMALERADKAMYARKAEGKKRRAG
jgi:diguanylate cyclase (GGDEF)-like protein